MNYSGDGAGRRNGNGRWPMGWAWDSGYPRPEYTTHQSQAQPSVNLVKIDWRDILGAQGTPLTSRTSPFKFNSTSTAMSTDQSFQQNSQVYTGTGSRQEVEGQSPATFRVSVGKSGDFGQLENSDSSQMDALAHEQKLNTSHFQYGEGNSVSKQAAAEDPVTMSWLNPPNYEPCGKCHACKFQQCGTTSTQQLKRKNFICRKSHTTGGQPI